MSGWLGMYGYSYGNQLFQTPSCVQAVLLLLLKTWPRLGGEQERLSGQSKSCSCQ